MLNNTDITALTKHLNQPALLFFNELIAWQAVKITVVANRKSKLGDFRPPSTFRNFSSITINSSLNKDCFAFILAHEIAHYKAFQLFGKRIRPHGKEWKKVFSDILSKMIALSCFTSHDLLVELRKFSLNPKSMVTHHSSLYFCLFPDKFENNSQHIKLLDVPEGCVFSLPEKPGQFIKGAKRKSRFFCVCVKNKRLYTISQNARVVVGKNHV